MIGLLVLGDAQQPTDGMFRCVAITDGGIFAAAIWVPVLGRDLLSRTDFTLVRT